VATPAGEVPIASLKAGDTVQAYDPATHTVQSKPVQHVFINHDSNLLDVTLAIVPAAKSATQATSTKQRSADVASHGSQAPTATETLHTTTEHPFLTTDRGWVNAQDLVPGERVQQLDGSVGVVVSLRVVAGTAVRYNLTVTDVHTFAVGADQWVVHNTCNPGPYDQTGGHHIHAQSAFDGHPNYDPGQALSISQGDMAANGWSHQAMTNTQRRLFKLLDADVQAGIRANTMAEHSQIALQALMAGGVPTSVATDLVQRSELDLASRGVFGPTRIPWYR
jgi:hypothetical protein